MGRNEKRDFKGEKLSNATHASVTDPAAKLNRKSSQQGADLYYIGHALMENCNGLVVETTVTEANGSAEREAALAMDKKVASKKGKTRRITLGADKSYPCLSNSLSAKLLKCKGFA